MPDGSFVPLGEEWACDDCTAPIPATAFAFVHTSGQEAGRCICVTCIIDPDTDGSGEHLAAWKRCRGYKPDSDAEYVPIQGLPPKDNSEDSRGPAQASSHTLLQNYK